MANCSKKRSSLPPGGQQPRIPILDTLSATQSSCFGALWLAHWRSDWHRYYLGVNLPNSSRCRQDLTTLSIQAVDESGRKLELGCLFESAQMGYEQMIPKGRLLLDGDEVVLEAWCGEVESEAKSCLASGRALG